MTHLIKNRNDWDTMRLQHAVSVISAQLKDALFNAKCHETMKRVYETERERVQVEYDGKNLMTVTVVPHASVKYITVPITFSQP